jgi:hypothetical protein
VRLFKSDFDRTFLLEITDLGHGIKDMDCTARVKRIKIWRAPFAIKSWLKKAPPQLIWSES